MQADRALQLTPTDGAGLEELVETSRVQLGQFLVQVLRDRRLAEDVLQETLLVAFERREKLMHAANPRAWLFGVARNRALQTLRGRRRARRALERLVRPAEDVTDPAEAVAVRDLLVRTLSPDDRTLVVLRYVHGFETADLALMTGLSADALRQRLSRARRRLIVAFEEEDRGR
jgi:RNA polymerase sigma-70 factor, ECF subfamily